MNLVTSSPLSVDSSSSTDSDWDNGGGSSSSSNGEEDTSCVISDCESSISGADRRRIIGEVRENKNVIGGFVKLEEHEAVYGLIKTRFLKGLGGVGEVVAVHRNPCGSLVAQAKVQSFKVWERAVAKLRGGNANVKYGWFGTLGENDVRDIVANGFGHRHGQTLVFSADHSPLQSVKRCVADKDGVRHLLLCRVILGRSELIIDPCNNKQQCNPSSEDYDSGVDSFSDPKNYIIWSSRINTHVLPAYLISYKLPSFKVSEKSGEQPLQPSSPWMPFPSLISVLSKNLPPNDITIISMLYKDHKDNKISRHELIQKVRRIAGDKLLIAVIKSYKAKRKTCKIFPEVQTLQHDN
ncbi:hypothetical protein HN51_059917 [Arachis hypogaea]|uniref:Inactive poly [ADP-ribose] polymerase SRO5 n=1 Tax=Arachis hypogaea TaxID=3818 RepID=A0A444X7S6_ARAHY|nr:probable inactive poly [ADP-ribose] polymerase SRO5 isoform X1 [Arachis ipaensis]XP_025681108.1 probable inactive poly [ADP-ribose] polymerase SRO5 isoform X1 [Arachis hypogaea]QHN83437.1 putative inactive poly [ADP-ribose] polymerase [Arachis hypogaea]RYQ85729.1 hypothetical protein Ahy_B10g105317 [Arachis hypogaea]